MRIKFLYELLQQDYGYMQPVDLPNKTTADLFYYEICITQVLHFVDFIYLMVFIILHRGKQRMWQQQQEAVVLYFNAVNIPGTYLPWIVINIASTIHRQ